MVKLFPDGTTEGDADMSGTTVLRGKNYGAAQILAAVGSELTPCTKALAVAGMDQGTIKLEDIGRYVPGANMDLIASWRQEPEIQERLTRQNVVPLVKRAEATSLDEATFAYRGKAFTATEVRALLKGERMTPANKAIVLLAIDRGLLETAQVLRENRWLNSVLTLNGWRSDNEVRSAMETQPQTVTLHDKETDALFRPCRRKTATG
jgi:hypothetical protein